MFYCNNCRCKFDEPEEEHTTYERYYGVSSLFSGSTPMTLEVCPECGSDEIEEIEEIYEEDDEEEDEDPCENIA